MKYGLIGADLSKSPSAEIHKNMGNRDYILKELSPHELKDFITSKAFLGLNVTMPYKKAVLDCCDILGEAAELCGNVNTVTRLGDGRLRGDNTDYPALLWCLNKYGLDGDSCRGKTAVICGSGGAGQTAAAACRYLGAEPLILSRGGKHGIDYNDFPSYARGSIIINAAPADIPGRVLGLKALEFIFDFRYNIGLPEMGVPACDGYGLLLKQAELSEEIWRNNKI